MRLLLIAALATSLFATTYTVKPDGTGDFTTVAACANFSPTNANPSLAPGDTCLVYAGSYGRVRTVVDGTSGNPITFRAAEPGAIIQQFDIRDPYQILDGFEITGMTTGMNTAQVYVYPAGSFCQILNNTIHHPQAAVITGTEPNLTISNTNLGLVKIDLVSGDAATDCIVRGNTLYHPSHPMMQIHGSNHLIEENLLYDNNKHDFFDVFGHDNIIRRNRIMYSTGGLGGQHPDVFQTYGATNESEGSYNIQFVENFPYKLGGWTPTAGIDPQWAIDLHDADLAAVAASPMCGANPCYSADEVQVMQTNSSWGGVGDLAPDCSVDPIPSNAICNITFKRNVFVDIGSFGGNSVPQFFWLNNTFFRAPRYDPGFGFGGGFSRGRSHDATLFNNSFVSVGADNVSLSKGFYGYFGASGVTWPYFLMTAEGICYGVINECTTPQGGATANSTAIFNDLRTVGLYINNNGVILDAAFTVTGPGKTSADLVISGSLESFRDQIWTGLKAACDQNLLTKQTFNADYNYIFPKTTKTTCTSDDYFTPENWCEIHGVNTGTHLFQNASNPLGPDGIPFTVDDGLKPLPGSSLCGSGKGGVDIGAYSCDPATVFSADIPAASGTIREVGAGKTHATIAAAITAASVGDTVLVYPGDYSLSESQPIAIGKAITLQAKYPANNTHTTSALRSTIQAVRLNVAGITVDGMDITKFAPASLTSHVWIDADAHNCKVTNNYIHGGVWKTASDFVFAVTDAVNHTATITSASGGFITKGFKVGAKIYVAADLNEIYDPVYKTDGILNHDVLPTITGVTDTVLTIQDGAGCSTDPAASGTNRCTFNEGAKQHTLYVANTDKYGIYGIFQLLSGGSGASGCTISGNKIEDIAGFAVFIQGTNTQFTNNDVSDLHGFSFLRVYASNNTFRGNLFRDSPRWDGFYEPAACPPVCHSSGSGTWDVFSTFFFSSATTTTPVNNTVFEHNVVKSIANSLAQIEYSSMSANCPTNDCGVGMTWKNNIFADI
jgi:hypothetical protein